MNDLKFAFRQLLKNPGFTARFQRLQENSHSAPPRKPGMRRLERKPVV